jgi:DNA-binding MarR family transcriptional regulator
MVPGTMNEHKKTPPIGYWLKRADELLTKRIDEAQRSNGLTRLGWQALNVIRDKATAGRDDLVDALRPFADPAAVDSVVLELVSRDLVAGSESAVFSLTPAGNELYEKALAAQLAIRQQALAGITEAEYASAVDVLERLVANLERGE